MDSRYRLPGGIRVGWDGILGVIPGVGDLVTNGAAVYILARAALLGVPGTILFRMAINLVIDNFLDAIPFLGNIADFFWKANLKNMALIDNYMTDPRRSVRRSRWANWLTVGAIVLLGTALIAFGVFVGIAVLRWLFESSPNGSGDWTV